MKGNLRLVLAFAVTLITLVGCSKDPESNTSLPESNTSLPESNASFDEVDSEVGCLSKYSEQKKEDIFKSQYKNHWMTWTGTVVLAEADNVSIDVNEAGTQDIRVDFVDKNAGYNLTEGSVINVRFIMDSEGGCFLPFGGREGTIQ